MTDKQKHPAGDVLGTTDGTDTSRNSDSFVHMHHLNSSLPFVPRVASKKRITSQDWVDARSLNEILPLPMDFSFNDVLSEDDPKTSALQSFSESQLFYDDSCTDSELNQSSSQPLHQTNHRTTQSNCKEICEPTDLDVLLGRGGGTNNHPGNIKYRDEVEKVKPMYFDCNTKDEKKEVSELLVAYVQDYGGRFLKKDRDTDEWILASPKEARKKASQALRETKWKISKTKKDEQPD